MRTTRYCFALDLVNDADLIDQYKQYHRSDKIWSEIVQGIRSVGILDMEIWAVFDRMFMIMEVPDDDKFDLDKQLQILSTLDRQQEWEQLMSKFQKPLQRARTGDKWVKMERIFKLPQ
jgi:L-rhamnose mutarotase